MKREQHEKKTILIVDDDPFMQGLFGKTLEREGFKTLSAVDGLAAVDMLPNLAADLIVLDLMLPRLHGLKVLEIIRADSRLKDLPVLILSNAYLPEIAKKALKAGATKGMPKAECSPARLVEVIRDLLKLKLPCAAGSDGTTAQKSFTSWLLGNKSATLDRGGAGTAKAVEPAAVPGVQSLLMKDWQQNISAVRQRCVDYVKSVGTQESSTHLDELHRGLRFLGARAAMGGCARISQLTDAFQAMLFEHVFQPKGETSPSMLQTMAQAVDGLEYLFGTGGAVSSKPSRKANVLLVDDNPVCNMACEVALRRADFETSSATDGAAALALLQINSFDLILLDVNMPGLSGFEVCEQIRALPQYRETPIIFVTLHSDFQNRAQSVLSGANGLIAKPIAPLELIVKVIVFLLRSTEQNTLENASSTAGAPPPKLADAARQQPVNTQAAKEVSNTAAKASAPSDPEQEFRPASLLSVHAASGDPAAKEASAKDTPASNRETKEEYTAVTRRVQTLTELLKTESGRREAAEKEAAEAVVRRAKLERDLAQRTQAQEQLRAELAEYQMRLEAQAKGQQTDQASLAARTKELAAAQAAVTEVKAQHASVTQQMQTLSESLKTESDRRAAAEKAAAELAARRAELERDLAQRTQAQEQLRAELAEHQKRLHAQAKSQQTEQAGLIARTKELEAAQPAVTELQARHASVTKEVQTLTESLKTESDRRAAAEKAAAELVARRAELECELAQRTQAQEQLRAELAEQQERFDAQAKSQQTDQASLAARTKELAAAQAAVTEVKVQHARVTKEVQTLAGSLNTESGRRAAAEKAAAELATRRAELERDLAQRTQAQEQLRAELAEQQKRLEAQAKSQQSDQASVAARTKELAAAQAAVAEVKAQHAKVTKEVQTLAESLKTESDRRAAAEKAAAELAARRAELERELAQRTQAQEQLRAELAEQQKRLEAQAKSQQSDQASLAARTKELAAAQAAVAEVKAQHANVTKEVQTLAESFKTESDRRAAAEKAAAELAARRAELERDLAQRTQAQEQLRVELAEQQKRLEAQARSQQTDQASLAARTKELEAAQAAVTELQAQHANVTGQVQTLSESLKAESGRRAAAEDQAAELAARRAELEWELAQRTQAQQQLRAELAEQEERLEVQARSRQNDRTSLAARTKELAAAQAAVTELQAQHASVTRQVQTLSESLNTESGRRAAAEKQAAELAACRAALERELAHYMQAQEQLRTELAKRTKELEAPQAGLMELKTRYASVTKEVQALAESLRIESGRRAVAEKQAAEVAAQRAELERELAQRMQAQERLRAELAGQFVESERVRVESENQVIVARGLASTRETTVRALELELQQRSGGYERLDKTLQTEVAHRRRLESQLESVQSQLAEAASELARNLAADQVRTRRESELQSCTRSQQDEIAKAGETLRIQEAAIKNAREKMAEMQVVQSALCAKVQELTGKEESAAKHIQELKEKAARSESAVVNGQKNLAVLRYAILDAARMNASLHRKRSHTKRQTVDELRQHLSALAHTPLSLAQHRMLAELEIVVDGLNRSRSDRADLAAYPVELPALQIGEFCFSEVIESAFRAVRTAAEEAGVAVQTSASGITAGNLLGNAEHIHQLITLLAESPLTIVTHVSALDLRAAIAPKDARSAQMTVRVALSSDNDAPDLLARLRSVTAAASTLQTESLDEAELGLAAGWQLAQALGAEATIEGDGNREACLVISLPLEMDVQPSSVDNAAASSPSVNGNGNGYHPGNGSEINVKTPGCKGARVY